MGLFLDILDKGDENVWQESQMWTWSLVKGWETLSVPGLWRRQRNLAVALGPGNGKIRAYEKEYVASQL